MRALDSFVAAAKVVAHLLSSRLITMRPSEIANVCTMCVCGYARRLILARASEKAQPAKANRLRTSCITSELQSICAHAPTGIRNKVHMCTRASKRRTQHSHARELYCQDEDADENADAHAPARRNKQSSRRRRAAGGARHRRPRKRDFLHLSRARDIINRQLTVCLR